MESGAGVLHRDTVMEVLNAALRAADPYLAVLNALRSRPDITSSTYRNVYVLGAGKAGAAMAHAAEEVLGERIASGLVIVKDGHLGDTSLTRIELVEASHPVPDTRCVDAADRILQIASNAVENDLILCLISGGGSALLTSPAEGISLEDMQATTQLLLHSGATINELNAVRKHLSRVSGGLLARAATPAQVISLILSDVTGSPLDVIASGPTAPDPTTYADALGVLERYGLMEQVPTAVIDRLRMGVCGAIPDNPKPSAPLFSRVSNHVIASNVIAVEAAAARAAELGLNAQVMSTYIEGEAREIGVVLAGITKEMAVHGRPVSRPGCVLLGGETTVTLKGNGVGGRNTEVALAAAISLQGWGPHLVVASLATDGGDGTSPSAGAIADGTTIDREKR